MPLLPPFFLCCAEAVVFLRTLGDFKIPAVIERRRKELLEKLTTLQGDTIKEAPPIIEPLEDNQEPSPTKEYKLPVSKTPAKEESATSSADSSTVTSPSHGQGQIQRRDSKVVTNRIKDYESIHFKNKLEEENETPKRLVQLKKVSKPQDFPSSGRSPEPADTAEATKEAEEAKEKDKAKDAPKEPEKDTLEVDGGAEKEGSLLSVEGTLDDEEEEEKGKKKKKKKNKEKKEKGLKVKDKREKRGKSPVPERKNPPAEEGAEEPSGESKEVEAEALEEGVRIKGTLERKKKGGLGGTKKVKMDAKVHETTLILDGKEKLDLAHCSVEATDSGFDLMHPQHKSGLVFKVEGGEEERQQWLTVLKEAIAEATPAVEQEEEKEKEEGEMR